MSVAGQGNSTGRSVGLALRVLLVRLRFFFVLGAVLLLVGGWPTLRGYWDRLTRSADGPNGALSLNMEYWCPMCPGVVGDFPGKCPVCNMILIRREKGEPAPLPDGVVARMQFSPYRVQLAGIRTASVEHRPLNREVVMVGKVSRVETSTVSVDAEVFEKDLPLLAENDAVEVESDLLPGRPPFVGKIAAVDTSPKAGGRSFHVQISIDDPNGELRHGAIVTCNVRGSVMRLPWWRRARLEEWKWRTTIELAVRSLMAGPCVPRGLEHLLKGAVAEALDAKGMGLAIPQSAVIDHGARKVAFVESGTGMFDAVEVTVGPRCGDYYPVLRGVEAGQRVATAGAFLLDAEMWLNHGLAATYFGATRGANTGPALGASPPTTPKREPHEDYSPLSPADRALAVRQKVCPVTGELLDSMGGPIRVEVSGRTVFVCCQGCDAPLRKNPEKYLATLPMK
jgi:membrane fusion protein, copper/silver efflux system